MGKMSEGGGMIEKCDCTIGFLRHEIVKNRCSDCHRPIFESVEVVE
jgi:hypothetical protein